MPRFFFNIREGERVTIDEEGLELASVNQAIVEAEASARDILADMLRDGRALDGQAMEVTDERGEVIAQVPFKSVFWLSA